MVYRTLFGIVVGVVAMLGSIYIGTRIPGGGISVALLTMAAWVATERSREIVGLFREAVNDHYREGSAAIDMGIRESQLSEGFAGTEQLSLSRAAECPDDVWEGFAKRLLERAGYVVLSAGALPELVQAVREQTNLIRPLLARQRMKGAA